MNSYDWTRVAQAVAIWSGWGVSDHPNRDKSRLVACFGAEATAELMPVIRQLEDDFYASDARHRANDLLEMAAIVAEQFKERYPDAHDDVVKVMTWCYTYDYK